VVRLEDRVVEEDVDAVAGEVLERPLELDDSAADRAVVLAQNAEQLLGLGRLGEGGEAAQVAEDGRDRPAVAGQELFTVRA
jgi:hypothetical protein